MPHLMNCPHTGDGWCLECVGKLNRERFNDALESAVSLLLGKPKVFRSTFERDAVVNDLRQLKEKG